MLGLPYAFASHFAPAALHQAIEAYRERFEPSAQLAEPYVMAAVNVIAADDDATAERSFAARRRMFAKGIFRRPGQPLSEEQLDALLASPQAAHVDQMLTYTALGTPDKVAAYLEDFRAQTGADELITVHQADSVEGKLRSLELTAEVVGLTVSA
jgi:alkanesulfonate monooxygenase SsuD/methylene tetrahydromethanopterin reductase-like flavin-dependent oxidoreductase (luciferase family)